MLFVTLNEEISDMKIWLSFVLQVLITCLVGHGLALVALVFHFQGYLHALPISIFVVCFLAGMYFRLWEVRLLMRDHIKAQRR